MNRGWKKVIASFVLAEGTNPSLEFSLRLLLPIGCAMRDLRHAEDSTPIRPVLIRGLRLWERAKHRARDDSEGMPIINAVPGLLSSEPVKRCQNESKLNPGI